MKQRVVIAMSTGLLAGADSADEPTTALDVTIQAQVLELMNELKEKAPYLPAADYPRPGRRGPGLRPGGYHVCR